MGQPFVRLIQRRFAADSMRSMTEALEVWSEQIELVVDQ
jgi:hypothetical protein